MSEQSQDAFENFLRPIAEKIEDFGLKIKGIMSDKQRGLLPAIEKVFDKEGLANDKCEEPAIKSQGERGVITAEAKACKTWQECGVDNSAQSEEELCLANPDGNACMVEQEGLTTGRCGENKAVKEWDDEIPDKVRDEIVEALLRRVRYLLTLKGRPPFRLAGLEMYERLTEFASGFRDYKRGLLRITGQVGATRRLIARSGAWEILGIPDSWENMVEGISEVNQE